METDLATLLTKLTLEEKHLQVIAINDLIAKLQEEGFELDEKSKIEVPQKVLNILVGGDSEVRQLCIKCLVALIKKLDQGQIEDVFGMLSIQITAPSKKEYREIAYITLRTLYAETPFALQAHYHDIEDERDLEEVISSLDMRYNRTVRK